MDAREALARLLRPDLNPVVKAMDAQRLTVDDILSAGERPGEAHVVTLVERGPFLQPVCTCGWMGAGRRSRPAARDEADRHGQRSG